MLTQGFVPFQRGLTGQAVVAAPRRATAARGGDPKQHLLQVCHRLTEKADRLQVADRRLFLAEDGLTLAAGQPVLHLGDNVLVEEEEVMVGFVVGCTFAFRLVLLRGLVLEGGR